MNSKFRPIAAAILAVTLAASYAGASDRDPGAKPKKHATAAAAAKKPTCDACDQIDALKTQFQGQIDALKQDLAAKDAALAAAQKAAADAQASADKANAAISA
jgi:Skp family chaperone for outer membrane proteins